MYKMEGSLSPEEFCYIILSKDPIPNFDVAQRVEEFCKYLRKSIYPQHVKNIRAIIKIYNLKELPGKNTH
jgi:hypothetical protein